MAKKKDIRRQEIQYTWKGIRDMAKKGIGHSNLSSIAKKLKKESKKNKK